MTHSTLSLAEFQFFLSLSFMAIFFAIEFGLSWMLFIYRLRTLGQVSSIWLGAYRTWVRVFALALILSLAASIPVIIFLGSLWPQFMATTALLSSPLLAVIIVTTLMLKSSFLGLMLYGQRRLTPWVHCMVIGVVAVANTAILVLLAFWFGWLHFPVGGQWQEGSLMALDWAQVFTNPLAFWYLVLFAGASFLLVALMIQAFIFWQSLRRPAGEAERRNIRLTMLFSMVAFAALIIGFVGHGYWLGLHQPQKAAALSGYWHSASTPQWLLGAWADEQHQGYRFSFGFSFPQAFWLGQDEQQQYIGLDKSVGMLPPLNAVFWFTRLALLLGLLMLVAQLRTWIPLMRRHFDPDHLSRRWRRWLVSMPCLAVIFLWSALAYQFFGVLPYAIFQVLTTSDLYAHLPLSWLIAGTASTTVVYLLAMGGFILLLRHVAQHGVVPVGRQRGGL